MTVMRASACLSPLPGSGVGPPRPLTFAYRCLFESMIVTEIPKGSPEPRVPPNDTGSNHGSAPGALCTTLTRFAPRSERFEDKIVNVSARVQEKVYEITMLGHACGHFVSTLTIQLADRMPMSFLQKLAAVRVVA